MNARLTGPWVPHVGLDYACVMLPGETTGTASIDVHTDDPEERDEILFMIAAVPEMLKALREIASNYETGMSHVDFRVGAYQAAWNAIQKAEGKS